MFFLAGEVPDVLSSGVRGYQQMRMFNFVQITLILTGIVLRIGYFLTGRPLSVGETHYAANIFGRSYREILYHLQILPDQPLNALGFYLAEKMVTDLFGHSVAMLRMYPLVCALSGLLIFAYLSRCYLTSFGATMALGFFALSEWLVVTGAMISPYASDVLLGLLAVFAFEQVRRREFRPQGMLSLTILGALSMWFSYAAIFVWLAMLICLTDQIISLRYVRRVPSLMGLMSVWLVSFLSLYLVCLSNLIQSPYAWYRLQVSFSPAPYWSLETLMWTVTAFLQMFEHPVDFAFPLLGVIFFLAGAAGLVKRNPEYLMILVLPVLLTMLFGSYRVYPVFGREVIFLLPFIYFVVAAGLAWARDRFARTGTWIGLMVFAALMSQPLVHLTGTLAYAARAVTLSASEQQEEHQTIVMLGDSLFALNDWGSYFNRTDVVNLGVVGDQIDDVRARVPEVQRLRPAKVFLMVGINNHPARNNTQELIRQYRRLILELQRACPQSHIYINTVLPVNSKRMQKYFRMQIDNTAIAQLNRALRGFAMERGVTIIDAHPHFLVNGELNPAWTTDGVHLNREGYIAWLPWLQPYVVSD